MSRVLSKEKLNCSRGSKTNQRTEKRQPKNRELGIQGQKKIERSRLKQKNESKQTDSSNKIQNSSNSNVAGWIGMCPSNINKYLQIRNATNIRVNRARIFDWYLDVSRAFELRWEAYWCAIQMLDFLIFQIGCVRIQNIHIISATCLIMACKIHQRNPPALATFIDKALYHVFSKQQIFECQAKILLWFGNSAAKPSYMVTIYNSLYELYPQLEEKFIMESIRRFILIWMDPIKALEQPKWNRWNRVTKIRQNFVQNLVGEGVQSIRYNDLVKCVVEDTLLNIDCNRSGSFNMSQVQKIFKQKYQCENIEADWMGFERMKL